MAAVLVLLGFLIAAVWSIERPTREGAGSRRSQLVDLIEVRRAEVAALDEELADLRAEVSRAQQAVASSGQLDPDRLEAVQAAAGLTEVSGSGVIVTLDDPEPSLSPDPRSVPFQVIDRDLQELTNALWASGAEAIAVDEERLVATTAIRNGGDTITVNYRPLAPPYEVVAVGVNTEVLARADIVAEFERWSERYGVGFSIEEVDEVTVPGFSGRARLRHAQPLEPTREVVED